MLRYLIIGDSHVPKRATIVPKQILEKLEDLTISDLFENTFFTGDLIDYQEFIDFLNIKTKGNLFIVRGNMDYYYGNRDAPMYQKMQLSFSDNNIMTIGLTHGHQIASRGNHAQLESLAMDNNYNILISGHTHKEEVFLTSKGILLLNPGSVTGAWSFLASGNPSFIVLMINEKTGEIYAILYQMDKFSSKINELKILFLFKNSRILYK
ncbi:MAG: YfcE family phosphodiesterase [Promethearchaeota archaeon]